MNALVHIDTAFYHQLLYIPEAEIEPEIHPNGTANNVWMEAMTRVD